MTGLTARRKARRQVIRVSRALVILLMTAIAGRRQRGVVVVHVAICAGNLGVETGQGKWCVVVIEGSAGPRRGVVAGIAGLGETAGYVVRIRCALEIFEVASYAGAAGEPVISVDVALRALQRAMRAGKSESRRSVVETRSGPGSRSVATVAGLRERRLYVIRIRGGLIILQVASDTGAAAQAVISVDVALRARQRAMRAG